MTLTVFQAPPPAGWLAFDAPGPSMATSGGMLPCEQLASALAEGVHAVGVTETDHQRDAYALYLEFKASISYTFDASGKDSNEALSLYPALVAGRSSDLGPFGTALALFTPADPNARRGGARAPDGWTLADFLTQAEGRFNVALRPYGPRGLFTLKGFNPALPLPQAAPWWDDTGPLSMGRTNGSFDAIEILNAGTVALSGAGVWWDEFRKAREAWFSLISRQGPASFTKAVGFSGGRFSQETPVGLVRTWLFVGDDRPWQSLTGPLLSPDDLGSAAEDILGALRSGAAVVSSGPVLLARVGEAGPGELATFAARPASVELEVTLIAPDWVPVEEIRVVVHGRDGRATHTYPTSRLSRSEDDSRVFKGTIAVPVPSGGDAWLVAEAGAPLNTAGAYMPGARAWNSLMKGIYPVSIANPIFLGLGGEGYTPPGLAGL
jgi:hypothetical protein